jgi:hypothetical protein
VRFWLGLFRLLFEHHPVLFEQLERGRVRVGRLKNVVTTHRRVLTRVHRAQVRRHERDWRVCVGGKRDEINTSRRLESEAHHSRLVRSR